MAKKTCLLTSAHIVRSQRWVIDFSIYNRATNAESRHRKDFKLHEIEDLAIREAVAQHLLKVLPDMIIEVSVPVADPPPPKVPKGESVIEALDLMRAEKTKSKRKDSNKNYRTSAGYLREFLYKKHIEGMPLKDFGRRHAKEFRTFLLDKGRLSARTVNNYMSCLVTMWNALEEYGINVENPFARMKKERQKKKHRRTYTTLEKNIVVAEIEKHYWLYRALLLLYYCGVRRNEMCRLRFAAFDFQHGLVKVQEEDAKTYKERIATIPTVILPLFCDGRFDKYPKKNYVFGREWRPNPDQPLNPNRISKTHRNILDRLIREGKLPADVVDGLDFYAWKDTAITRHMHITSPIATRDQVGHSDLKQTLAYYHAPVINQEYRDLPDTLHEKPGGE